MNEDDLAWARKFVASLPWTYAETVPESPHEYVMRQHCADRDGYERLVALIREAGEARPWQIQGTNRWAHYTYLSLGDGYDYWATTRRGNRSLNRREHVEDDRRPRPTDPEKYEAEGGVWVSFPPPGPGEG